MRVGARASRANRTVVTASVIGLVTVLHGGVCFSQPAAGPSAHASPSSSTSPAPSLGESLEGAAKADYLGGRALFTDGDFAGALVKFRSAHERSKDHRLLWNVAACERGLRHYAQALRNLQRFEAEAVSATDEERREAAELVTALRPYVADVAVRVNERGARVAIDDQPVGETPLDKVIVDIGEHRLVVHKDGFVDHAAPLTVKGPEALAIDVVLVPAKHDGRLSVVAASGDTIAVDGRAVGAGTYEGTLRSGVHVVRVTAPGKKPFESRVVIEDDQLRTLDVTLESPPSKFPLWAWAGIGAVAATGLAVGGYFAFRGTDDPEPVAGTMPPSIVQLPSYGLR